MSDASAEPLQQQIAAVYHDESRRILATLIRHLRDFDLAEEAMHDAFAAALTQWQTDGVPRNPRAWLISAARHKALDILRRQSRFHAALPRVHEQRGEFAEDPLPLDDPSLEDDRLRLIFICCHPALPPEAQIALTLREVCGLTTEQIAAAYLVPPPTIAQRIVRAKAKIRDAAIPYELPPADDLANRLDSVLHVIYLVFNEGYSGSSGAQVTRLDLTGEAIRLARLLVELLPEAEARGLLALMLLHEARAAARVTVDGDLILLQDQDRSRWDRALIAEGVELVRQAFAGGRPGPYAIQAAIAALHAEAPSPQKTDWHEVVGLYDLLLQQVPSPVIELNRAVAVAMRDGPEAGLRQIDAILARGDLRDYHLAHAARADLLRRLGDKSHAREAYVRALALARQAPERRFLQRRLDEF